MFLRTDSQSSLPGHDPLLTVMVRKPIYMEPKESQQCCYPGWILDGRSRDRTCCRRGPWGRNRGPWRVESVDKTYWFLRMKGAMWPSRREWILRRFACTVLSSHCPVRMNNLQLLIFLIRKNNYTLPVLFLSSCIKHVEQCHFIINYALLTVWVYIIRISKNDIHLFLLLRSSTFNCRIVFVYKVRLDKLYRQGRLADT